MIVNIIKTICVYKNVYIYMRERTHTYKYIYIYKYMCSHVLKESRYETGQVEPTETATRRL